MKSHLGASSGAKLPITLRVMTTRQQVSLGALIGLWIVGTVVFWAWWARPSHIVSVPFFVACSFVIAYAFAMPAYYFFFLVRMRRPNPELTIPPELRVTFATTFVPGSESQAVLERTVRAMKDQEGHPHDVWVLDEGDDPEVKDMCRRLDVRHFSRKGTARYQGRAWPFKARTKAGNYNAWLDWLRLQGIEYDVLLQMDTDHVPQPGYMVEMLRPFADPAVAYVAAPSITSGNKDESWVVRARYEVEATLHGTLQMGYNGGWAPIIIGSHAGFRMSSLRAIGGFQHTLAEDHHNTVRLNGIGGRGVFSPDAIAIGDGATSFAQAMVQEYQWARALTQILLQFFPKDRSHLPPRLWTQFLFAQTWYPLFALTQAIGFLSPAVVLLTGIPWAAVSFPLFLALYLVPTATSLAVVTWVRRNGWLRPADAPVVSWRAVLLMLVRWPYVLLAVFEALAGWAMRRDFAFRVTAKGKGGARKLPIQMLAPYAVVMLVSLVAVAVHFARGSAENLAGYVNLALFNAATYGAVLVAVVALNARENLRVHKITARRVRRMHVGGASLSLASVVMVGLLSFQAVSRVTPVEAPVTAAAAAGVAGSSGPKVLVALPTHGQFVGVYDPTGNATAMPFDVEQVYIQWGPDSGASVRDAVARIVNRGRVPIITVEPYPWNVNGLGQETLLTDISSGRYDPTITAIAQAIRAAAPNPVYVRFGHEMEQTGFYPWSQGRPAAYIAAYRHFVDAVRQAGASNAAFIWSPVGNSDAVSYYPGPDVVDMVGTTILETPGWGPILSFEEEMQFRYSVLSGLGKPIVVNELGASLGDAQANTNWLVEARRSFDKFPLLAGAVLFDGQNPPLKGGYSSPDWRLGTAQIWDFLSAVSPPTQPIP